MTNVDKILTAALMVNALMRNLALPVYATKAGKEKSAM